MMLFVRVLMLRMVMRIVEMMCMGLVVLIFVVSSRSLGLKMNM